MSMNNQQQSIWDQPNWIEQVRQWINSELSQQSIKIIGVIEQPHVQPWSTVLRIPTNVGDIFFKASAPVIAHEPAITQALYRWRPECIPQVLAIDEKQGWMLMTDGGQRVREAFGTEGDIRHWNDILTAYADLQITKEFGLDKKNFVEAFTEIFTRAIAFLDYLDSLLKLP